MAKAKKAVSDQAGQIFIGIGGWTFEPWHGVFYPEKLVQAKELSYAASKLTSIEINGTCYGSQKPESFRKWASEVPDGLCSRCKGRASPPTCANLHNVRRQNIFISRIEPAIVANNQKQQTRNSR